MASIANSDCHIRIVASLTDVNRSILSVVKCTVMRIFQLFRDMVIICTACFGISNSACRSQSISTNSSICMLLVNKTSKVNLVVLDKAVCLNYICQIRRCMPAKLCSCKACSSIWRQSGDGNGNYH